MYSKVTMNLAGARKRYETLDGKQYLVVPAVALTVGVHNGTQGPLFYPPNQLSNNPVSWNHKPVVIYHPTLNGEGISACDPSVVEKQGVGMLFNSAYDGRLKVEAWLDEDKLKKVDFRVLDAINANQMVEVSTGLYHDLDPTPGEWKGEKYVGSVQNIQPDHLAILYDQKGACSIADGAGLLRNASSELSHQDIQDHIEAQLNKGTSGDLRGVWVRDVFPKHVVYNKGGKIYRHAYRVKDGKAIPHGEPEEVLHQTSYVCANGERLTTTNEEQQGPLKSLPASTSADLSDPLRRQQFTKALKERYSGIQQEGDWGGWVTDLYANYVVWSKDNKLFRLPYTYDDDKISFDGEPEEIERVSEYRSKTNTPIDGTQSPTSNLEGDMTKAPVQNTIHQGASGLAGDGQTRTPSEARKQQVNKMISGGVPESDRTYLENLEDSHFEKVSSYVLKGATQPVIPYGYEGVGDRSNVHNTQQTMDDYIKAQPPELREMLLEAKAIREEEKQHLIKVITANQNNRFNKDWLVTQSVPCLRGMAALAGGQQRRPVSNYAGQAEVPMFVDNVQPTQNADQDDTAALIMPGVFSSFEERKVS